jgi:hypothetical protein
MIQLFDDIRSRRIESTGRHLPSNYPFGENGLSNVLADIESELMPLGIEDYGEGISWPIPGCGVKVVILRETNASVPLLYIKTLAP